MSLAKSCAVSAAPIPLRLILALTFVWAGLGKFIATMPVQGDDAALLANMGVNLPAPPPSPGDNQPAPRSPETGSTAPETGSESADTSPPIPEAESETDPDAAADAGSPAEDARVVPDTLAHAAEDFPDPIDVQRLNGLALLTYHAANPKSNEDGTPGTPIWPEWAARDHWPVTLAWAAAITEVAAAILIFVGLLTRLSSLALAGVMIIAAWLTQFGPAIQSGDTLLGFLPNHDLWDIAAWRTLLWQIALIGAALALTLAGPGAVSLDRAIGTRPDDDDDFDDDDD